MPIQPIKHTVVQAWASFGLHEIGYSDAEDLVE